MTLHPPISPSDHSQGNAEATLVMVQYGDFECPYSAAAVEVVRQVQRQLGDQILYVFRPFPLYDIHPNALQAAQAGEIAAAQGKFWPMYDMLFANQDQLSDFVIRACAERVELDLERFDLELEKATHLEAVKSSIKAGHDSGAHGTPTFFINGKFYDNHRGLWEPEAMFEAIEKALR